MVKFGKSIEFKHPIISASGCWVKSQEQIDELYAKTNLSGIVLKTCTLHGKDANPLPNFYRDGGGGAMLNCMGCPNNGYEYYKEYLYRNAVINNRAIPIIMSILGSVEADDLKYMITDLDKTEGMEIMVEINISCPNIKNKDRIIGFHCSDILDMITILRELGTKNLIFGFKLPPYLEIEKMKKIADILHRNRDIIQFITCCNTIPNGIKKMEDVVGDEVVKNGEDVKYMTGGISGKFNKMIALSNVSNFCYYLYSGNAKGDIKVIGCGGIETIEDVNEYLECGASLVQLGSCFYDETVGCLDYDKINDVVMRYYC